MLTQVICKSKVERADVWAVSLYIKVRRHHWPKLPLGYCNLPQSARQAVEAHAMPASSVGLAEMYICTFLCMCACFYSTLYVL